MPGHSPYVFVHGLFGPLNDPAIFEVLAPARCSAPDLDGYGQRRVQPVALAGQVSALRAHIEKRHPEGGVTLVAHSIGAVYAFTLADRFPELVTSIVTIEGRPGRPRHPDRAPAGTLTSGTGGSRRVPPGSGCPTTSSEVAELAASEEWMMHRLLGALPHAERGHSLL